MKKNVSIIIPNYNGESLLQKHLPDVISASKYKKNNILEIIVVDDGSKDQSAKILKKDFPQVRLIKHKVNRGFSASINTGIRSSKGEILVLLNTDVSPQENFVESVLPHFDDPDVFAVSFHEKGYGPAHGHFINGFLEHDSGREHKKVMPSFWASGGSAAFRRTMMIELGGMDEALYTPFYWEDVDLGYRAQKRGWKVLWEPNSHVIHNHEGTTKVFKVTYKTRIQERNQLLLIWRNITSKNLFRKHLVGLLRRVLRGPGYIRIVCMALSKLPIVIRSRKKEKKEERVSDEAIFAQFKNV